MNLKRGFNRLALVLAFLALAPAAWAGWSLSQEVLTRRVNRLEGVRPELKDLISQEPKEKSIFDDILGRKEKQKEERAGRVEEFSRRFPDLTDQERGLLEEFQETGAVEAVRVVPPPAWQRYAAAASGAVIGFFGVWLILVVLTRVGLWLAAGFKD